eukprot:s2526_g3.t1
MSTKFPLPLLLMELSETWCLDVSWIPREKNQWANDLTNQKFDRFCMSRRLILDGAGVDWTPEFHAELVTAKRKEQTSGYQKKQRTKWCWPSGSGFAWEAAFTCRYLVVTEMKTWMCRTIRMKTVDIRQEAVRRDWDLAMGRFRTSQPFRWSTMKSRLLLVNS